MVFGTVTRRTNAPEPGRASLRIAWGVATFAIIGVLGLAQLAPVRDAILAEIPPWVGPFLGQLAGPPATPDADPQLGSAAPAADANSAVAPATDEAWPNGSRAIAVGGRTAVAAPVDGVPEPAAVIAASAEATIVQPTAEPGSTPIVTGQPTAALPPTDAVAPALVVSVVLNPLTTAVAVPLASVTAAVTAAVTTVVATAVTTVTSVTTVVGGVTPPTAAPTLRVTLPGGGTMTTVR